MPIALKQSTASQEIPLGYFVDSTDGNTEETGLTIANTDIKVWKTGATTLANKNSGGATHISNGIYYATFDATDTDTLGPLVVFIHVSGALPVKVDCEVLPANVYDSLYNTDRLQVDVRELGDANLALTTQMKLDANAEVDTALNTAIPGTNTADSVNDVLLDQTKPRLPGSGTISTHAAADVWSVVTRALTDKAGFTISGAKTTLDALNDITAASVWAVAARTLSDYSGVWTVGTRALTDKASFSLAADQSAVTVGTVNAVGDKTGYALSATAIDAIIDEAVEGTLTVRQAFKIFTSALVGKSGGGGTATLTFQDFADTKPRITATVDANGNRTAITLDGT